MVNMRKIAISAPVFGGWVTDIDIDETDSLDDIVKVTIDKLTQWINKVTSPFQDMYGLHAYLEGMHFHVHSHTYAQVLLGPEDTIYVCSC